MLNYLKFDNVLKCAQELENLSKVKDITKRNNLIKKSEDCVIDAISEIALNCLNGNIPLHDCDFKSLSKYQAILRKISKLDSVKKRKYLISQKGGFLSLLIPPALSLITSVVGGYISKRLTK